MINNYKVSPFIDYPQYSLWAPSYVVTIIFVDFLHFMKEDAALSDFFVCNTDSVSDHFSDNGSATKDHGAQYHLHFTCHVSSRPSAPQALLQEYNVRLSPTEP